MPETPAKTSSIWVKLLKWLFGIILVLIIAFVGIGLFVLDGKYDISREITIKASPAEVHKQVGDLREWPNWLPFTKHDKTIVVTIEKPTGVGANQHWKGNDGVGELNFTASDEAKGVEYDMLIDKQFSSKGSITYAKAGDDTRVTWRMHGQSDGLLGHWMAFAMKFMMESWFDEGLRDLKNKVEAK